MRRRRKVRVRGPEHWPTREVLASLAVVLWVSGLAPAGMVAVHDAVRRYGVESVEWCA